MIVVAGGGPAGRYAAIRLAKAGRDVKLVDKRGAGLGGQCLHEGCMVICALNDVARFLDQAYSFHDLGFMEIPSGFSYNVLISKMIEIIHEIAGILDMETKQAGVELIQGNVEMKGGTLFIDGNRTPADAVIIATGTHPKIPDLPGYILPGVYTAHTILSMRELPKNMVIIGGGVVAAEYAYIFSMFGVNVTILARSTFLRSFSGHLISEARKDLRKVSIVDHVTVMGISGSSNVTGVMISKDGGIKEIESDAVLLATGTVPNTDFLSGFELTGDGSIIVNDLMETSVPGVYAAGDVTGKGNLTPLARHHGRKAADTILGRKHEADPIAIPQAIKLRHDLAFCRIHEEAGKGISIPGPAGPGTFWQVPARQTGSAVVEFDENRQLISLSEASPAAAVSMAYLGWIMNAGIQLKEFEKFIEIHPSSDGIPWLLKYLNGK